MKTGSFWSWSLGLGLVALPLIGGCLRTAPEPSNPAAFAEPTVIETEADIVVPAAQDTHAAAALPLRNVEEATIKPVPSEFVLPPNVQPGKTLTDLIRLAQAGAEEGVLLAFVTNSPHTFNPRADDIIYLKDIGVPSSVVSAMLQRDEQLKAVAGGVGVPGALVMTGTNAPAQVPYAAAPTYTVPSTSPEPMVVPPGEEYVPENPPAPPTEEIYPEFYDSLAPYGSWVVVSGYGYCWQPAVVGVCPGWTPYYDGGYWAYTDCGWYWRSDYSWGWAPFHYGRWFHHNHWGWCWQPDRVWAPSWVCWRHNDRYCGWAPLPPGVHYSTTAGLTDRHNRVAQLTPQHFRFVEWGRFSDHNLAQHRVAGDQATHIFSQTTLSTRMTDTHGRASNFGLAPERVSAATHTTVTRVTLRDAQPTRTGGVRAEHLEPNGQTLSVYRPSVTPVRVTPTALSGRSPGTKPWTTSTTTSTTTQSATTPSAVTGSAPTAPVTPPPSSTSQRALNPTRGAEGLIIRGASRGEHTQTTTSPDATQPPRTTQVQSSPIPAYQAASRYYRTPGSTSAERAADTSRTRPQTQATTGTSRTVQPFSAPAVEQPHRVVTDNSRPRVQAPEVPRYNASAAERPRREVAPAERPARAAANEARVNRSESRPSAAESHVSRPESRPTHSAPAPAPSSSSSRSSGADKPDRSDSGSRGGGRR